MRYANDIILLAKSKESLQEHNKHSRKSCRQSMFVRYTVNTMNE